MKYIMLETVDNGVKKLIPIIFPDFITHSDIATHVQSILETSCKLKTQIRSAGSISLDINSCYGESITMSVRSKAEDASIIQSYDYLHGIVY